MRDLLSREEALARVLERTGTLDVEDVPLDLSAGRVLASPAVAGVDLPSFEASAMDGFALRAGETPGTLRLAGRSVPGVSPARSAKPSIAEASNEGRSTPANCRRSDTLPAESSNGNPRPRGRRRAREPVRAPLRGSGVGHSGITIDESPTRSRRARRAPGRCRDAVRWRWTRPREAPISALRAAPNRNRSLVRGMADLRRDDHLGELPSAIFDTEIRRAAFYHIPTRSAAFFYLVMLGVVLWITDSRRDCSRSPLRITGPGSRDSAWPR